MKIDRVLILGNSITFHAPKPEIGWTGNCGMAASAPDKDYAHLLLGRIALANGRAPAAMLENIAGFEREHASCDIATAFGKQLAFKADLVVLAINENVPPLTSAEDKIAYKKALLTLLGTLQEGSHPAFFVRSSFWPDQLKDEILREACQDLGGTFVDIGHLSADEANFARSERAFANADVAKHPGDRGMAAIADALWQAMAPRLSK